MEHIMETERLYLRRFHEKDYKDLYEYLSQWEVVKYEPYNPLTLKQCVDEAKSRSHSPNYWAVILKEDGKMVGNIYFRQSDPVKFMTWELGYIFNPFYWGNGYATEAAEQVLRHGFEDLKAHRVVANCNPENGRSWKLMERLGMRRERHAKNDIFFRYGVDGKPLWQDSFQYAMLREEFFVDGEDKIF